MKPNALFIQANRLLAVRSQLTAARALSTSGSVQDASSGTSVPNSNTFTIMAGRAVTPRKTGRFLVVASTAGSPAVNGLTTASIDLFDGSAELTGSARVMLGVDSSGTNTTRTIGGTVEAITGVYPLGVPVTFSIRAKATTQGYTESTSTITVTEL